VADWQHKGCGGIFAGKHGPPVPCPDCGRKPTLQRGWRRVGPTIVVQKKRRVRLPKRSVQRKVYKRDGRRCCNCGSTERLTIDHIVPRSRGGSNALDNLQVLCHDCNQAKGNSLPAVSVSGLSGGGGS
jgi:5-methylcytosine-specific restriction endonuclease McrA